MKKYVKEIEAGVVQHDFTDDNDVITKREYYTDGILVTTLEWNPDGTVTVIQH